MCFSLILFMVNHFLVHLIKRAYFFIHLFLDLGITDGHEIAVADSTSPKPIIFRIYYETKMD